MISLKETQLTELRQANVRLLAELGEEARAYQGLLDAWQRGEPVYGELYASVQHLAVHSALLTESLERQDEQED